MTIYINGTAFDKVTELSADRTLRRTEIKYNTQGDMLIDMVNRKYRLTITFGLLTAQELAALRALCGEIFVEVTFPAPTGEITQTFHISDEPAPTATVINGVTLYGGVTLTMLQK